jgi:hypothetical protein
VKNPVPIAKRYARKAYLKFDLQDFPISLNGKAQLILHQTVSPFGFASRVPDSHFSVYALKAENEWEGASLEWKTAPGNDFNSASGMQNDEVIRVGTFFIPAGQQQDVLEIDLKKLPRDGRRFLTLVLTRETPSSETQGLAHAFYAGAHPSGLEPRLRVKK